MGAQNNFVLFFNLETIMPLYTISKANFEISKRRFLFETTLIIRQEYIEKNRDLIDLT